MDRTTYSRRPLPGLKHLAMAILFGPVASLGVQAQQYYLTDLGPGVSPTDISNDGTIVGSYTKPGETLGTAFRYSGSGAFEDIGGPGSVATGVNDLGQVVGNTPDGAFLLDDGAFDQWSGYKAYGISEIGWISGSAVMENPYRATPKPLAPAVFTGKQWEVMDIADVYSRGTRDGVYADLYALKAINWGGIAVGERRKYGLAGSSAISVAYPYTDVISAADVEYLSTGGTAEAINDAGTIVGTGSNGEAFLCDDGSCVGLGTLQNADGEYGLRSSAYDVNEAGQVVGNSWLVAVNTSVYDPSQYHAVLWDSDGTIQDLNDMAGTELGWVLTSATAINYNGDIVGTGLLNGEPHGFLLTAGASTILPPAPQLPPAEAEPSAPNESPVAIASADTVRGKAPLTVTFSSAGSYDPEGLGLTYEWTFGDASTVSNDENPEPHTYTEPGDYVATLVVADEAGNPSDPAVVKIRVQKGRSK